MTPIEWMLSNDTGISSKTICAVMTNSNPRANFWAGFPHDPADFGRCYRLLKLFPEWRGRLPEVAERFPEWSKLVIAWDELTDTYENELNNADGRLPILYRRMQELNKP